MSKKRECPTKSLGDLEHMLNLKELMHYYLRSITTYFLIRIYLLCNVCSVPKLLLCCLGPKY